MSAPLAYKIKGVRIIVTNVRWRKNSIWLNEPVVLTTYAINGVLHATLLFRDEMGNVQGSIGRMKVDLDRLPEGFPAFCPEACPRTGTLPIVHRSPKDRWGYFRRSEYGKLLVYCADCRLVGRYHTDREMIHPERSRVQALPWNVSITEAGVLVPTTLATDFYVWSTRGERPDKVITKHCGGTAWTMITQRIGDQLSWMLVDKGDFEVVQSTLS